jgi:acyl CoA:acetate/3-ketoacid CoA transferase beta subunit
MPTRSISGSTLASDNPDSFAEIDDPFHSGVRRGILRAINPDLSIIHGCASDESGNSILAVPNGDDMWGALASLKGVLVTVERIVPREIIRRHSSLVKIPSWVVKAVCPVPLGIHPYSLASPVMEAIESYETDEEFLKDLHWASYDPRRLDEWINEWVMECPTHAHYLRKLGERRISALKETAGREPSLEMEPESQSSLKVPVDYTRDEIVLIAAAREIADAVLKADYRTMLVGAGSWSVAARLAYHKLLRKGHEIELITGNGQIGYIPQPGESSVQTVAGIYSSKMLTDTIMTHGVFVGGKNSRCLSVLGAGQVDKYGNINSSRTSGWDFLIGTGGANDAANANEVILILHQSRERFVETLAYITAKGDRVSRVISTMGIFNKGPGREELSLVACLPAPNRVSLEERIKEVEENCAWPLRRKQDVLLLPEPTKDELKILRSLINS